MSVTVVVPAHLRELTPGGVVELEAPARTVREAFDELERAHPALYARIVTERRELRPHVNVFVGREDIRWSGGLETALPDGSELIVLPSVSGG
jgi:MoaD family protein